MSVMWGNFHIRIYTFKKLLEIYQNMIYYNLYGVTVILNCRNLYFYVFSKVSTMNMIISFLFLSSYDFTCHTISNLCVIQEKGEKEEEEEEEVRTEFITDKTNLTSSSASKARTAPHKSNTGFPKLLCASLLMLLLLMAISFFIAFVIFFQKYSQLLEKKTTKDVVHTTLECVKKNMTTEETAWNCCPKNWKSFSSNCYFISTESASWQESEKNCARMEAHLLVINTQEEQKFIFQNLEKKYAYFVGLSDPEGQRRWQWVDQTPYNESSTFWHQDEPSDMNERCVMLNFRYYHGSWGWNDVSCDDLQSTANLPWLLRFLFSGLMTTELAFGKSIFRKIRGLQRKPFPALQGRKRSERQESRRSVRSWLSFSLKHSAHQNVSHWDHVL
nr:C-type lectin domain family 4 member A isoform X1 [Aotus nancymaae]